MTSHDRKEMLELFLDIVQEWEGDTEDGERNSFVWKLELLIKDRISKERKGIIYDQE